MREMAPLSVGIAAWGLMTGVAMVKSGTSVVEAVPMTLLVYAGSSQLAAIPLLVARRAGLGDLGDGLLRQPALRGVQPAPAALPDAPAALAPAGTRLPDGRPELRAVHARAIPSRRPTPQASARRRPTLAGNYCVTWVAWMGCQPGRHRAGQPDSARLGPGLRRRAGLVGHLLLELATTRLRMLGRLSPAPAAVAAYALPLKLNIVVAIAAAVGSGCAEAGWIAARKAGACRAAARRDRPREAPTDVWTRSYASLGLAA